MPLRSCSIPAARRWQQQLLSFHSGAVQRQDSSNHYETLGISPNASHSDVKKSFYKLSKTHHPDRNPSDPGASQRFVKISEAYATLSSPSKRQSYDRANPHLHTSFSSSRQQHHGSYFSSSTSSAYGYSPAGGRAPSGLSKRRSQFRGPPPSFYRSGGWGEHGAKRGAAHESSTGTSAGPGGSTSSYSSHGTGDPSTAGGMGPGQRPYGEHAAQHDVPHFDRERHFRTHESQEARRRARQRAEALRRKGVGIEGAEEGDEGWIGGGRGGSYLMNFLFVSGIIGVGVFVPSFLYEIVWRGSGGRGF